jgi:hypothetical protein
LGSEDLHVTEKVFKMMQDTKEASHPGRKKIHNLLWMLGIAHEELKTSNTGRPVSVAEPPCADGN